MSQNFVLKNDEGREDDGAFLLNVMSIAVLSSIEHYFTTVH